MREIPTLFVRMPPGETAPSAHAEGDQVCLVIMIYLPNGTWHPYRILTPHGDAFEMSDALRRAVRLPAMDPDDYTNTAQFPVIVIASERVDS